MSLVDQPLSPYQMQQAIERANNIDDLLTHVARALLMLADTLMNLGQ